MKILISGYTTRMFGSERVQGDYMTFSYLLESILKSMGHTVERRRVLIGEEIAYCYDYAFLGVAPLSSMSAARVCETHYAMDRMTGRHAVYADDWSFCGFGNSVKYTLDGRWEKYKKYKKFPYSEEIIENTRKSLELMMRAGLTTNAPVLVPMFPWGDHQYLMRDNYEARLMTVDPSAWLLYPTVSIPEPQHRVRQWVMAALSDHTRWVNKQNFKLPVRYVGNKRMQNAQVLTEGQTIQLFADSFGVLSTEYPSAGSGWWRTRYLNAAWAESVVYCSPIDAATMGKGYQKSVQELENIDSSLEYRTIASEQSEWLMRNISDKDTVKERLERLIQK